MKTLYIHIGVHRTATSSIQEFMGDNYLGLLRHGFLYPFNVRRHYKFIQRVFAEESNIDRIAADLKFRANDKPADIHSIVISEEDICMRSDLSKLGRLREHFNVKIIYCLRRQDLWLESWYLQNIKWQWDPKLSHLTFEEFLKTREDYFWINYDTYLTELEAVFGQENIQIYMFERAQMPNGPITAFTDQIKLENADELGVPPNKNYSLSPITSEFMRCLPLDTADPSRRSMIEAACEKVDGQLREYHASPATRSKLLMTHEQRTNIMAEFTEGNKNIAQRYFDRDELFLEPLPDNDAELANPKLPENSYELMETMVAPFLKELIKLYKIETTPPRT